MDVINTKAGVFKAIQLKKVMNCLAWLYKNHCQFSLFWTFSSLWNQCNIL